MTQLATASEPHNQANTSGSLVLKNLVMEYVPGVPVLSGISLELEAKGITAIIGPSGTGKSTLIRCINRLVDPTSGDIFFKGQNLAKLKGRQLRYARRHIGMVFQEYNLLERLSVMENVLSGRLGYVSAFRAWLRKFSPEDIDKAFELLEQVGMADFANQRADALSGGQRQRVAIARALMQSPDILLADEPTSSLDPKTSVEILDLMTEQARLRHIPVVINIHDVSLAKRFADRIVGMSAGKVVFDGPPEDLQNDHLKTIYGGEDWLS
ncbi:MAG: phosphonate ABC transporter ATP-binding protein [Sneathiella sp.]|nr:phosphonate ABC transporter ATP-binding protein [Sneathiella sp.]